MSVLIVAFDGMDKELLEKYDCRTVQQEEYGSIEVKKSVSCLITPEVFASFLTGTTYEEHGVINKKKFDNTVIDKIENLNKYKFFRKSLGLRNTIYKNIPFLHTGKRGYNRDDLEAETFLDKVPDSKAIAVPAYNKGYSFGFYDTATQHGMDIGEDERQRILRYLTDDLMRAIEERHTVIMMHTQEPDRAHHWYWEVGKIDKVEETYHKLDDLAKEIKEKAKDNGYDTIIFMSDHGLPDVESGDGHNKNAFYSCNHELFPDKTPHITDFHDKILELTGTEESDVAGIKV